MTGESLMELCEAGQERLMQTDYLQAETLLAEAELQAWAARDWDALSRLYMPLQEARRQRRQRCGEGIIRLDLLARGPDDRLDVDRIVEESPQGQLIVAGWGSIEPALAIRARQADRSLYVETFLAAVYPIGEGLQDSGRAVVLVPTADVPLPDCQPRSIDALLSELPAHSIVVPESELPRGARRGTTETYAEVMALWERLHRPFLAAADARPDPLQKMEGYKVAIGVDYACELAHQKLSDVARVMLRRTV